ncbi:protein Sco1p, mitochondrial [Monosporozyma unispora]|nr:Cu-binding protein [Kazachstania unispora]
MFKFGSKLSTRIIKRQLLLKTERPQLLKLQNTLPWRRNFSQDQRLNQLSRVPIGGKNSKEGQTGKVNDGSVEFSAGKAVLLFLLAGGLTYYFFEKEKRKMDAKRHEEETKGYGKPQIGGSPFELIDHNGDKFTEQDLLGKFSLIYFGFSHCPDICPDELDKLGVWLDELEGSNIKIQPIFITCDPARDSPQVLKDYLTDFHDGIIGLTGSYDDVKKVCKQYRVYFSTPPNVKPGQDYLVDHSIFFYLMNPEGQFVDALGLNLNEQSGSEKIKYEIGQYYKEKKQKDSSKSKTSWF